MASELPCEIPPQLARFPAEVREAYVRFKSDADPDAVRRIVDAALFDFMPAASRGPFADALPDGADLLNDLGYDSIAISEIVFFFEDLFGVRIETRDLRLIHTVGDLRTFVARRLECGVASAE